jgi:hypothetical protein
MLRRQVQLNVACVMINIILMDLTTILLSADVNRPSFVVFEFQKQRDEFNPAVTSSIFL